jgi:Domain of unknown function (DUF4337)
MSHGTDKHLEHAEHAQHHAQDPFDRRVAMTMTIMAAVLAGVTLFSHRGHTETLRLATEATTYHTKATDDWNLYQAKNIRNHEYQAFLFLHDMLAKDVVKHDEESTAMRNYWLNQVEKYQGEGYWEKFLQDLKKPRKKAEAKAESQSHEAGESKAKKEKPAGPKGELADLKKEAEEKQAHAKDLEEQSHNLHAHVTWIDIGHLGLELALVFCAVAVLTKQRSFWMTGILFALVGSVLSSYGMIGWWIMGGGGGHH